MLASFETECRKWRHHKKLSQLQLSLAAEISQKHLSHLETGRSKPSRDMVLRLANAMQLSLRDSNKMLEVAGYRPEYRERSLEDREMAPVSAAIDAILTHQAMFPAIAMDKRWNVLQKNSMAQRFGHYLAEQQPEFGEQLDAQPLNIISLTVHPSGLRPFIKNWDDIAVLMRHRLEHELVSCHDEGEHFRLSTLVQQLARADSKVADLSSSLLPVLPVELSIGPHELSLFSVISTIGTPQDITTDEIRIESFYPMNEQTRVFFQTL